MAKKYHSQSKSPKSRQTRNTSQIPNKNLLYNLLSISMIIFLIIGSQTFLSSIPTEIVITPDTNFSTTSFSLIKSNQITFDNNPSPVSDGDIVPLKTGGYLRLKANQSTNVFDSATKYGRYKLNQIILLNQPITNWDMEHYTLVLSTSDPLETIELKYHFTGNIIEIKTPQTNFYAKVPVSTSTYINSDNGNMLYKITHISKYKSKIELVGWYPPSLKVRITLQQL